MNARYLISIFVVSVFPAPLSPLTKIDWLPCSLIIALRHLQRQKDVDLALQTRPLCTAASCGHHTDVAISEKDSQLSKCSLSENCRVDGLYLRISHSGRT